MELSVQNLKTLIVDDHFLPRQIIDNVLRDKGVNTIHTAVDGQEAQAIINKAELAGAPFHLIFLDWEMPVMTGIDVLKHFRAQPQFNNKAFVMLTAVSEQKHVMEAIKAGATAYIIKPVSPAAIGKKFDEILAWIRQRNPS